MNRKRLLLVAIAFSVAIAPQPVVADDDRPDNCERADVAESNRIQGEIASSVDVDAIKIPLERGDYVSIAVTTGSGERQLVIQPPFEPARDYISVTKRRARPQANPYRGEDGFHASPRNSHDTVYQLVAEESGTVCLLLTEWLGQEATFPYSYEFRYAVNSEPSWWEDLRSGLLADNDPIVATAVPIETPRGTLSPTETTVRTTAPEPETSATSPSRTVRTTASGPETPTPSAESSGQTDSDGDGVPDDEDYAPRDPDVQEKEDVEDESDGDSGWQGMPGFTSGGALVAVVAFLAIRRRRDE